MHWSSSEIPLYLGTHFTAWEESKILNLLMVRLMVMMVMMVMMMRMKMMMP